MRLLMDCLMNGTLGALSTGTVRHGEFAKADFRGTFWHGPTQPDTARRRLIARRSMRPMLAANLGFTRPGCVDNQVPAPARACLRMLAGLGWRLWLRRRRERFLALPSSGLRGRCLVSGRRGLLSARRDCESTAG